MTWCVVYVVFTITITIVVLSAPHVVLVAVVCMSVFVRLFQPTSVSNFPSHVISRATSQCWSEIKLDCQSMLQWLKHGKQILVERSRAGAGTELKSIPLPLHGSCRILKLKSCFLFTILLFVNNTRNLEVWNTVKTLRLRLRLSDWQ